MHARAFCKTGFSNKRLKEQAFIHYGGQRRQN
jgi:hypothetical protein